MGDSIRSQPENTAEVRYVVLFHRHPQGDHYDLMIEDGDVLATWKVPRPPEHCREGELSCTRINDHRRMYLDYEGPVSGNRGDVTRHDSGCCRVELSGDAEWRVAFSGGQLDGQIRITRIDPARNEWRLQSSE